MAEVTLEKVGKTFPGGVAALGEVSLRIADGELLALVGPSGSGKTTLLRLIAGLESPTSGTIRIGDRLVNELPPHRRDVAMVFQRPALYPHLCVRDNLAFGLKLRRWLPWHNGNAAIDMRVREVAQQLGLADVMERRPATLSGGQQQRVALGRALVRQPAVFLLDEPLSNLDAPLRLEMRRELHLLHRRLRATMIYVTHDQDEAMSLGERVAVLDQGVVRQVDRPQVLYDRPRDRFVAGFLGWPPMNLLDGELIEVEHRLRFGNGEVRLACGNRPDWRPLVNRPLILGIRPEDVSLADGPGEGRLRMEVRLVERLGPVQLVTLTAERWTVTARLTVTPAIEEGAKVFAAFDLTRAALFDPARRASGTRPTFFVSSARYSHRLVTVRNDMNGKELLNGVELLHREKNISRDTIFGAIEKAVRLAIHKCYDDEEGVAVSIDRVTGEIHAQKGEQSLSPEQLGRIAAQSAKQAIIQLLREEESQNVFNQYSAQKGDLVHGTVQRLEGGAATVTIGKVEALLPRGEQIPGESHHISERVKAVILDVRKVGHRVKIILSRTHPDFVRRLFETEIPEIEDQTISIKAVAREAGHRTKVAVSSIDMKVDCVGACVGVRGSRIKNIIDELGGERIDIVRWNDSLQVLIPNALQPAQIEDVMLYPRLGRAIVLVKEDQLSLAIGRRGQNVRLASKLVGWDIEIMTHEELNGSIEKAETHFLEIPGVEPEMVEAFIEEGFLSFTDLTFVEAAELGELGGVSEEVAEEIIAYAEERAEEQEEEARTAKPEAPPPVAPQTPAAKAAKLFAPLDEAAPAAAAPSEAKQTFESLFAPAEEVPPISPVEETGPAVEAEPEAPPVAEASLEPEPVEPPVSEQPATTPVDSGSTE